MGYAALFLRKVITKERSKTMLGNAVLFLIIAIIAGAVGFSGIAGAASTIAQILFVLFVILFLVSFFTGRRR
jgi:uncharacterized membrane protein YtjA (UPF0391 family)